MSNKLTSAQLEQIVGEVQRISTKQADELDRSQVQEILQELNLSPDLLDDALVQIQRREALAAEQRGWKLMIGGVAATALVATIGFWLLSQQHQGELKKVVAQRDLITPSAALNNTGAKITSINKQDNPRLFYHVTLKDAPIGQQLSLQCDWIDPNGKTVKQNRYQTKEVRTSIWGTHCQYQLGSGDATGKWNVKMLLDGKQLSDESFTVN
jgi:hypothetical protein